MRALLLLALLTLGYLVAIPLAGFPIYPLVVAGIFGITLFVAGAQNKALIMFLVGAGLLGYHFAVTLIDFPLWPIQTFAGLCVVACVISIARNKIAAGGQPA